MLNLRLLEDALSLTFGPLLKRSASKKYLSQNLFAFESDFAVRRNTDLNKTSRIREARILFIKSELLPSVLEIIESKSQVKIMLVGDSDHDWLNADFELPKQVKRIYLQNYMGELQDRIRVLPIGIEGRNWGRNGLPHLFGARYDQYPKSNSILIGPFSRTHSERDELTELSQFNFNQATVLNGKLSSFEYANVMRKHLYVACPRGNGQDTHRFWEAIYRGSVPIVLSSNWSRNIFSQMNLNFITVNSWSAAELEQVTLTKQSILGLERNQKQTTAYWPYWKLEFQNLL